MRKARPATLCRRSAATPSPIRCSARRRRPDRACRFRGARARGRQPWAPRATGRSSRREFLRRLGIETARGRAQGQGHARKAADDRPRGGAADRRRRAPRWASCSRRSAFRMPSSARRPASSAGRFPRMILRHAAVRRAQASGHPPRLFHARRRRVARRLREPQRRRRLRATHPTRSPRTAPAWRRASALRRSVSSPPTRSIRPTWWSPRRRGRASSGPRADALVTRVPGLAIGVSTADCGPVLLADAASRRDRRRACRLARRFRRRDRGDASPRWKSSAPRARASRRRSARRSASATTRSARSGRALRRGRAGQRRVSSRRRRGRATRCSILPAISPRALRARRRRAIRGPRSLHLCRAGALLQLPPRDPPRRAGLRPAHQRDRARRLTLSPHAPSIHGWTPASHAPLGFIPAEVDNNKTAAGDRR